MFGIKPVHNELLAHLAIPHTFHKLIKGHRGLDELQSGDSYYVYTGRGPSQSSLHIGHLIGLWVALALQERAIVPMFFMLSDDEKTVRQLEDCRRFDEVVETMKANAHITIQQLRTIGFTHDRAMFSINSDGMDSTFYKMFLRIASAITPNVMNGCFGNKTNMAEMFYPAIQMAPCFAECGHAPIGTKCIVIAGEDQDPFFRLCRDIARKLGLIPPIVLYTQSIPGLDGSEKMSTSMPLSLPIFLTDRRDEIKRKVDKIAIMGAGTTQDLLEHGADLERDVAFCIFKRLCLDQEQVELVREAYTCGLIDEEKKIRIQQLYGIELSKKLVKADGKMMIGSRNMRDILIVTLDRLCR